MKNKWEEVKLEGRSKYSTLPASFRRKTAATDNDMNEDGSAKMGTLPRNLHRNPSFSKRVRKSIRSWASQKGLIEPKEKVAQSEESTKPSSVVLASSEEDKVVDVDFLCICL